MELTCATDNNNIRVVGAKRRSRTAEALKCKWSQCTEAIRRILGFRALRLESRSEIGFLSTFTAQSVRIFIAHQIGS